MMKVLRLRKLRVAIVGVLSITCLVVFIVNYKTADELENYIAREDFHVSHNSQSAERYWKNVVASRAYNSDNDYYYIDSFDSLLITGRKLNKIAGKTCQEKPNFVFIKTMKCATETVAAVLRRFGYLRRLNFVLPRKKNIYVGWPYIPEDIDYRPSIKPFNILTEHSVFNKTVMSSLMPKNTTYISIIREPFSHFKSAFHYFNVANITMVTGKDKLNEYINNIEKYERFYKSPEGSRIRYCIPDGFSVTKNLLSHCLGMPLGFPEGRKNITTDLEAIHKYIEQLDKDFTLVMIMEYLHESLVLLKRLMCWSLKDIIYHTSNVGNYTFKHQPPKRSHLKVHRHWSSVDYILYDHFNRTFWRKIAEQGPSFKKEVEMYNSIQNQVTDYCEYMHDKEEDLKIAASEFNEGFVVSHDYCLVMGMDLLTFIKHRYDNEEPMTEFEEDSEEPKRGC